MIFITPLRVARLQVILMPILLLFVLLINLLVIPSWFYRLNSNFTMSGDVCEVLGPLVFADETVAIYRRAQFVNVTLTGA